MRSFVRGHVVVSEDGETWYYEDTGEPVDDSRPCPRCDWASTAEGHDACIGSIDDPNIVSVCCGHGHWSGTVIVRKKTSDTYTLPDGRTLPVSELSKVDITGPLRALDTHRKKGTL